VKQFIWMLCGIFLSGLLLGTLSACGTDQFAPVLMVTGQSSDGWDGTASEEDEVPAGDEAAEKASAAEPETVEEAPAAPGVPKPGVEYPEPAG